MRNTTKLRTSMPSVRKYFKDALRSVHRGVKIPWQEHQVIEGKSWVYKNGGWHAVKRNAVAGGYTTTFSRRVLTATQQHFDPNVLFFR